MSSKRTERLIKIYAVAERMRSAERRLAAIALEEVETRQEQRRVEALGAAAALRSADPTAWMVVEATREYAVREMRRLGPVREMRMQDLARAEAEQTASRLQLEQMRAVREGARTVEKRAEERQVQGASDDRFAAQTRRQVVEASSR